MDDYTNFFSTDQVRSSIAIKKKIVLEILITYPQVEISKKG